MKTVLTIQSQVAGARVGNSVAVFAMERLGVTAIALPTVIFGRRPDRGPPGGGPIPANVLSSMVEQLDADGALAQVGFVLSGYLASPEQADVVLDAVARVKRANPDARYVCDPVMGDEGATYVRPPIVEAMRRKLVPAADVLTPNHFELQTLIDSPLPTFDMVQSAARSFGKIVIVTSTPTASGIATLCVGPGMGWRVETGRIPGAPKGAGDLFAALFVGRRALGQSTVVALEAAVGATYDVIMRSAVDGLADLAVLDAQERLEHPETWPTAVPLPR